MTQPTRRTVAVDGREWAYLEAGSGPLLMLFHGTLSGKEVYAYQLRRLARSHRVVAFDWPGHGGTEFDPDGWTVENLVDAIPDLIGGLGAQTAIIGGVSQGGAVTMRAALRHPDRVEALITMSAGPDRPGPEALASLTALGNVLADGTDAERRAALEQVRTRWFHGPGWVEANRVAAERETELMLSHPRAAMRHVTGLPSTYESIEDRLGEITCPTLVIWGEHDVRAPWGPRMVAMFPDARLRMLADAGHHVTLDSPEATTQAIAEFLDEL